MLGKRENEQGEASADNSIEDTFVVVNQEQDQIPDDELDDLANAIMEATYHPINVQSFKIQREHLEAENTRLQSRVEKLEQMLRERQVSIVPRMGGSLMATSSSDHSKNNDGEEVIKEMEDKP
jgi:hypothetical protein